MRSKHRVFRQERRCQRNDHGSRLLDLGFELAHFLSCPPFDVEDRHSTRVVDMLNHLITAQINGRLAKALKTYVRPHVLLLDELGYLPIDKRGADLLFQVVAARYESGSIVLTTNRTFREWGTLFDVDNTLATALIDRLMHHGEALVIKGDSYRMKDKPSDPPSA
jgi:DNA replication protein DnaC